MPCSPYPGPRDAFTGSWKPSPGPYPSATSPFALVPTEHPASFGPNQRVWGLHSPLLSSPLQHSFPSCTRMAPESFCACSPHPHDGSQTRSFSSVYVFFGISMKKSLMNKIPFETDLPRCRDMSIGISHRKPDGTSFFSSSRLVPVLRNTEMRQLQLDTRPFFVILMLTARLHVTRSHLLTPKTHPCG